MDDFVRAGLLGCKALASCRVRSKFCSRIGSISDGGKEMEIKSWRQVSRWGGRVGSLTRLLADSMAAVTCRSCSDAGADFVTEPKSGKDIMSDGFKTDGAPSCDAGPEGEGRGGCMSEMA